MTGELVRYDSMCRAIAAAYEVDEVKDIRDRAIALEHYSRLAHNTDAEMQCCEIRLRAERKAGQLLRQMDKAKGAVGNPGGQGAPIVRSHGDTTQTLADLGISKSQSSAWQKLAAVPEPDFEAALAGRGKPTTNGIIAANAPPKITPVSAEALWLWGRLRDFERVGLLATTPAAVMSTMTPIMVADVRAELPRVVAWLNQVEEEE